MGQNVAGRAPHKHSARRVVFAANPGIVVIFFVFTLKDSNTSFEQRKGRKPTAKERNGSWFQAGLFSLSLYLKSHQKSRGWKDGEDIRDEIFIFKQRSLV